MESIERWLLLHYHLDYLSTYEIFQELIKQGRDLTNSLDAGADDILLHMKKMEEYRRALAAVKIRPTEEESIGLRQGRKALVISNSDYDKLPKLPFCKNDGEDMSQLLQSLGYRITENSRLIGSNDFFSMREAIYDFFLGPKAGHQDTLIFYYSGHATVGNGEVYLAPSDMDPDNPLLRGISLDEIVKLMQDAIPTRVITILDCSYSGAAKIGRQTAVTESPKIGRQEAGVTDKTRLIEEQVVAAKSGKTATEERIKRLRQGEGKCIMASSQGFQEAYALKEGGHSLFTYFLLKGLRGTPQSVDVNGNITPESLAEYVSRSMLNMPWDKRPSQIPIIKVQGSGDIILATYPHLAAPVGVKPKYPT